MSPAIKPLAARQREVLNLIKRFLGNTGEFPSVSYIARRLGIHHKTAQEHIDALYLKGHLASPSPQGVYCQHEQ